MASLVNQLVVAVREKPVRCGYVVAACFLAVVVMFALVDFMPAPYDFSH
jgi:hypothetical protein